MILYQNTLISEDVLEKEFVCNLGKCKGICCVEGDNGAPLEHEEVAQIAEDYEKIKPYMAEKGKAVAKKNGFWYKDAEGELVTQIIEGRECVFAIEQDGMWKCAIENAHKDGKTPLKKPISCHLYPIRLERNGDFITLYYDRWVICKEACKLGEELKVPVYNFLREALVRRFGEDWFTELEKLAGDRG